MLLLRRYLGRAGLVALYAVNSVRASALCERGDMEAIFGLWMIAGSGTC